MFLSAVFSSKLFEKTARLPSKNLADKRAPFTGNGGWTRLRGRTSSSTSGLCSQGSSAFQTSVSLLALSCLSCSSTAHSDSCTTAGRQADRGTTLWWDKREKEFKDPQRLKLDKMVKLSWNDLLHIHFSPRFCVNVCVFEEEKAHSGN